MNKERFTVGARGSALSRAQTAGALDFLRARFPGTDYRAVTVETPGDRDLTTPIEKSAPDFFTRDLDEAVRDGRIDFAIHSAKDLPPEIAEDLDWFWLPERADPRDCWVVRPRQARPSRAGAAADSFRPSRAGAAAGSFWPSRAGAAALVAAGSFKIGVSSERRAAYAKKVCPKAKLLPIRGSIDSRIQQLREGRYDAVLMALAGITRLYGGTPPGVELIPIPIEELTPPEAQGYLAVVFRAGDARLMAMRAHFVKAVRFVSAGVGDAGLCTVQGVRDLEEADVVLADELLGAGLVGRDKRGPSRCGSGRDSRVIDVGKRCGAHSMKQTEITRLICDEARKGRRVVRLKGGDAGLFGRLAEETDALTALQIPFVVRPGVSALVAATTGTGLLLTRRGESRGFTAYTPRSTGTETPQVAFMATRMALDEARYLVREGWPKTTPCAFVFDAAGPREEVRTATLGTVRKILPAKEEDRPGLFIVGRVVAHDGWPRLGPLAGRRVLVTCSDAVQARAMTAVEDLGGRPIRWPLIELCATRAFGEEVSGYDAIVLTSPSAVRIFFANCTCDLRRLGAFYTCGAGTDAELRRHGIASDVVPASDFSAAGLIAEIKKLDLRGKRVLRLRSAKAGADVARALRRAGAKVDDVVLYENRACAPEGVLPPFDDVFFASASAVESFVARYGARALRGKGVLVMGGPTRAALPKRFSAKARIFDILTPNISGTVPVNNKEKR